MRTNKKLTNKVVEWTVVDNKNIFVEYSHTRKIARETKNFYNRSEPHNAPFRIAKTVITK